MAPTLGTFTTYTVLTGVNYTVPSGTNRKAELRVGITCDNGGLPSSVTATLGGVSFTTVTGSPVTTDGLGGGLATVLYTLYMDDASMPATGSQALVVTITGGTTIEAQRVALAIHADCAQGQPTYAAHARHSGEDAGTDTIIVPSTGTFAVQEGSIAVLCVANERSETFSGGTGFTERYQFFGPSAGTVMYGTSKAFTGVSTGVAYASHDANSWWSAAVVVLDPVATSGPTIDTQPSAATAMVTSATRPYAQTAVFTTAATSSGGTLTRQWQEETSVGGGTYADISDGGIYAGCTTDELTLTPTDTSKTGLKYRNNYGDANGSTPTNGAALTVLEGDVAAPQSGTTGGSGTLSPDLAMTSDQAIAGKEFVRVNTIGDGIPLGTHVVTNRAP